MDLKLQSFTHLNAKGTFKITYNMAISHFANHITSLLGFKKEPDVIIPEFFMRINNNENGSLNLNIKCPKNKFDDRLIEEFKNKYSAIVIFEDNHIIIDAALIVILEDIVKMIEDDLPNQFDKIIVDDPFVQINRNNENGIKYFEFQFNVTPIDE